MAASIKGGVGKSTLVSCLAIYWMQAGKSVGLIDTDPNKTLTRWHEKGGALSKAVLRTELDEHAISERIEEMSSANDLTLVDCAGFGNQAMIFAIGNADLVLIPTMVDEASIYEALRTRKVVSNTSTIAKRKIPARAVLVRVKRSSVAKHARGQLEQLGAEPLDSELADRAVFQEATFHGSSPPTLPRLVRQLGRSGALRKKLKLSVGSNRIRA